MTKRVSAPICTDTLFLFQYISVSTGSLISGPYGPGYLSPTPVHAASPALSSYHKLAALRATAADIDTGCSGSGIQTHPGECVIFCLTILRIRRCHNRIHSGREVIGRKVVTCHQYGPARGSLRGHVAKSKGLVASGSEIQAGLLFTTLIGAGYG